MAARAGTDTIAVIGMGRFGESVARTLAERGVEVLVIDTDADGIDRIAPAVAVAVEGDATRETVLRDLSVDRCASAVVAIGEDLESSILVTALLAELGVPEIWSRAQTSAHGRILERVGAHHVVYPEQEMGRRIGDQLTIG